MFSINVSIRKNVTSLTGCPEWPPTLSNHTCTLIRYLLCQLLHRLSRLPLCLSLSTRFARQLDQQTIVEILRVSFAMQVSEFTTGSWKGVDHMFNFKNSTFSYFALWVLELNHQLNQQIEYSKQTRIFPTLDQCIAMVSKDVLHLYCSYQDNWSSNGPSLN